MISSVLFPVCGLPRFVTVISVYCLGRFRIYIHISSPSLASVLPGNPYLFLIFCFIPYISYLEPFHCPQVINPFSLFLIPFSFLILYFFFCQSVFHQRIRCFYFSRKLPSIYILNLIPSFLQWNPCCFLYSLSHALCWVLCLITLDLEKYLTSLLRIPPIITGFVLFIVDSECPIS